MSKSALVIILVIAFGFFFIDAIVSIAYYALLTAPSLINLIF